MAAIELHRRNPVNIIALAESKPTDFAQSLLDLYLPARTRVDLSAYESKEALKQTHLGCWNFTFQWRDGSPRQMGSVEIKSLGNKITFSVEAEGFDILRDIYQLSDGSVEFHIEMTQYPQEERGQGYGQQLRVNEIQWVCLQSKHPDSAIYSQSVRFKYAEAPPGQFVWRKSLEFDGGAKHRISGFYKKWVTRNMERWSYATHISERKIRSILPKEMQHPWSLDGCVLPGSLGRHLKKMAELEGYPGKDVLAWAFWNSDVRKGDPLCGKVLGWSGIRYVNRPWNGPI